MEYIIFVIIIGFVFGLICHKMAETRGRDKNVGFLLGFLFGILAIIGYAVIGQTKEAKLKEVEEMMEAQERAKRRVAEQYNKKE